MTDSEVVRERRRALRTYIEVLRTFADTTLEVLEHNFERRWAVLHGLQLAIECVQDISAHLVAGRHLGSPTNHTEAIDLLSEGEVLPRDLAVRIRRMPGFRNVIVHEYLRVDLARVLHYLSHLEDFEEFSDAVARHLEGNG